MSDDNQISELAPWLYRMVSPAASHDPRATICLEPDMKFQYKTWWGQDHSSAGILHECKFNDHIRQRFSSRNGKTLTALMHYGISCNYDNDIIVIQRLAVASICTLFSALLI